MHKKTNGDNTLSKRLVRWVTEHPWLKLFSLILAVLVWLYVTEELSRFN